MATVNWRALDRRLRKDEKDLHDCLWSPGWAGDRAALRGRLLRDAQDLDRFIGAGGKLRKNSVALLQEWERDPNVGGGRLFELLSHTFFLTAARQRAAKGDFRGAGEDVLDVTGSVAIGTCSAADCFELVEEWEGGKTDFETFTGKLADALEAKGAKGAGEFKRVLNAAWSLARSAGDARTTTGAAIAAHAAIANAAWCTAAVIPIRGAVMTLPDVPFGDLPAILAKAALS